MVGRKGNTPAKLQSAEQSSLSWSIVIPNSSTPAASNDSETELDITEKSGAKNDKKLHVPFLQVSFSSRKYLKLKQVASHIALGHIHLHMPCGDSVDFSNVKHEWFVYLHAEKNMPKEHSVLKLGVSCHKNVLATVDLKIAENIPQKTLEDLMSNTYHWILLFNKENERNKEILDVVIATTANKTPILKAAGIVELFCPQEFHKVEQCQSVLSKTNETAQFFQELKQYQLNTLNYEMRNVCCDNLLPTLRNYQLKAVQWMLAREEVVLKEQNTEWVPSVAQHLYFSNSNALYYNKYSEVLSIQLFDFPSLPRGGILADEMGLGKTVVVIALILNHTQDMDEQLENIGDLMLPKYEENECEIVKKRIQDLQSVSYEEKEKNLESSMNAHEKLVCTYVPRGALKRALDSWYESKLSEYSCSPAPALKKRKRNKFELKCVCGGDSNLQHRKSKSCVQCPDCGYFQHENCVGYKPDFRYFCPSCWSKQKLLKSNATLIVSPTSICYQWLDEIHKHVRQDAFGNGVLTYSGVKDGFVQPSVLASYDIVITTYDVLRAELNYALPKSTRKLRQKERFLRQSSPLTLVQWWRLCLDEAQMVESHMSVLNQMAKLLKADNLWAVTGTPIQKSIHDLFFLVDYLGIEPFRDPTLWKNFLHLPFSGGNKVPLFSLMGEIFWRSSKAEVADSLMLPNQSTKYHLLKFTAVEQNFYTREHAQSSSNFKEGLRRSRLEENRTIHSLDKPTLNKLLAPLLNLRQACSHPMAVHGNKITAKTGSMTLQELLDYLCDKTKVECEEGLRRYVSALNGLAGIHCIREEWLQAVEQYRTILQLAEEYKERLQVDSLQLIHTLNNMAEILQFHGENVPPTLRDSNLKSDAKGLEDKYMQKASDELTNDKNTLAEFSGKVTQLNAKFHSGTDVWWNRLLILISEDNMCDLLSKMEFPVSLNENQKKNIESFTKQISSARGMEVTVRTWLGSVEKSRNDTMKEVKVLCTKSCDELADQAIDCHLRTFGNINKKENCPLCCCESLLLDYECSLFAVTKKLLKKEYEKIFDGSKIKGYFRPHNAEIVLRNILSFCKSKAISEAWCLKDGKTHMQMLEMMKKEFKQLRAVWMSLNHQVQARDELLMSKQRLRLRLPGEPIPPKKTSNLSLNDQKKVETIFIIEHHEVDTQRLSLLCELETWKSEFKKKYGTLLYLRNLGEKGSKPEPCPVCKGTLENAWCVLQCGHSYCIDCVQAILKTNHRLSISCPVCRELTKSNDLCFVDLNTQAENPEINVVGDHSTKVTAIVRTVLELKQAEPNVKILIFSTWTVVLKILGVALECNNIAYRRLPGSKNQQHLQQFKDPTLGVTVLLLPISWGSKGLNLVEATHVFLVEPIMNPAEELQAIGRIHRIGQTKETVVHRFLMNGTIEEKIHSAVSEAKDKWNDKDITLADLKNLFVI